MSEASQQPQPDSAEETGDAPAPASEERVRPIPVRAVPLTSAGARASFHDGPRERTAPPPAARSQPEAPVPVREEPPPPASADEPVRFEKDGRGWLASVAGRGVGGYALGTAARLALVTFAPEEHPDEPALEALLAGRDLDALSEDELRTLLGGARPFGPAVAPEPSDSRPRGGRRGPR